MSAKSYFLFVFDHKFVDAVRPERLESERILRRLVRELPAVHAATLEFLMAHLHRIAQHSSKNKVRNYGRRG